MYSGCLENNYKYHEEVFEEFDFLFFFFFFHLLKIILLLGSLTS